MFSSNASQVSNDVKYIEDVCSVYLRTGTGSSQTVTTGIKENTGALVISKSRSAATDWAWYDTFRGATYDLVSNSTAAQTTQSQGLTSFNADGHTWGTLAKVNTSGATYVDTVLKPTPKFFDVVTFTSDGSGGGTFNHNLGSVPGGVIMKSTDVASSWITYHQSTGTSKYLELQSSAAQQNATNWISVDSTTVTVASGWLGANRSIVAYLFAHDAGGFGLTGTDNVISCGSYTGNLTVGNAVTLGYEPQWVLIKRATGGTGNWYLFDNMRGMTANAGANANYLYPNLSNAEVVNSDGIAPSATGFTLTSTSDVLNGSGFTYIYIAIRRGPMKVPTDATKVFAPVTYTGDGSTSTGQLITTGFPVDMGINRYNRSGVGDWDFVDRLRGITGATYTTSPQSPYLNPHNTNAEALGGYIFAATNTTVKNYGFSSSFVQANYLFQRAPSFFDEVCYTGTGANRTVTHNLTVAPELLIFKQRNIGGYWMVYPVPLGDKYLVLQRTDAVANAFAGLWNSTAPTSSVFSLGTGSDCNQSGGTYVAYLFATCAGVSKVGSYTGDGTTNRVINCGFTSGARFVMLKKTSTTSSWYVYDTARGIVSGGEASLSLNTTAAESGSSDVIDPDSTGFSVGTSASDFFNESGVSYIFLAIA